MNLYAFNQTAGIQTLHIQTIVDRIGIQIELPIIKIA